MEKDTIFVKLRNEGTEVWRPVIASKLTTNIYKIEMPNNYDSDDENWQFKPYDILRCETRVLSNEECLIAIESVEI